jgi:hypothetical protein
LLDGALLCIRLAWTVILLFVLPQVAGMTGTCHSTQPLVAMRFSELQTGLELQSSLSLPPKWLRLQT